MARVGINTTGHHRSAQNTAVCAASSTTTTVLGRWAMASWNAVRNSSRT